MLTMSNVVLGWPAQIIFQTARLLRTGVDPTPLGPLQGGGGICRLK